MYYNRVGAVFEKNNECKLVEKRFGKVYVRK